MISWFAVMLELSARLQIRGSTSQLQWLEDAGTTSWQIYKQILALKEFSQSIFVPQKKALKFELLFHCLLEPCFEPLKVGGKKQSTGVPDIEFWISHWRIVGI